MNRPKAATRSAALAAFLLFAAGLLAVGPAEASRTTDARASLAAISATPLAPSSSLELVEPIDVPPRFGFAEDLGLLDPKRGPGGFVVFAAEAAQCELTYARNNPLKYVDPDGNAPQFFGVAMSVIARQAAVGAVANVALNAGINHLAGQPLLENAGREALIGAAIGAGTPMGVGLGARFLSRFQDARLIGRLAAAGVKHNADDIVRIAANAEGKVVFLEKGSVKAGLEHILTRHGDDFARAGIPRDKVADAVMQAATKGKIVGYQGKGTGRPILEYTFEGKLYRMAVTVGDNGFVVGANPVR